MSIEPQMTASSVTPDDIRAIICDVVSGSEMLSLGENQEFEDSGIDSLDHAHILLTIQEKYGVEVPEGEEDYYSSIGKIMLLFA